MHIYVCVYIYIYIYDCIGEKLTVTKNHSLFLCYPHLHIYTLSLILSTLY